MTPDLSILIGFARGVLLSLRCTCQCLHSGSWILSGFIPIIFGGRCAVGPGFLK